MSVNFSEIKTERDAEIYIQGMYDLMMMIGGDSHSKSYDPITFEGKIAHSYVLELDDGGRHHSYISPQWVALKALLEFSDRIRDEWNTGRNEYFEKVVKDFIKTLELN